MGSGRIFFESSLYESEANLFIPGDCEVDQIEDVEWNPAPFESLVLPDGYKDLILSFVESQLKHGEAFADVINGKGLSLPSRSTPYLWIQKF